MKEQFEISPEQDAEWRQREKKRLEDGTYTPLPMDWRDSHWFGDNSKKLVRGADDLLHRPPRYPDHFTHVSVDKVAMIAFTENDHKGVRDRQTRINPGKYLARFFSEWLTPADIQSLATQMGADYDDNAELLFAKTADEIEHVYLSGPRSCMAHTADHFDSSVHPTRVYAGFDLAIAYLKRNGDITARTLVWPEKNIYSRLYGDEVRLSTALTRIGYTQNTDGFHGAKITRLMEGDCYVIPYLDYMSGAVDKDDHLELVTRWSGLALCCDGDCQNGLSDETYRCLSCDNSVSEDAYSDDDGDRYCNACWHESHWQCEHSGDWHLRDSEAPTEVRTSRRTRNGMTDWDTGTWCERAVERNAFFCDHDEVYYRATFDAIEVGDETWGPEAVERDAAQCAATGDWYPKDETVTLVDGRVWCEDYFAEHGTMIDGQYYANDDLPDEYDGIRPSQRPYSPTVVQPNQLEMADVRDQPIVVGCLVTCVYNATASTSFTVGKTYKVTRVYNAGNVPRLSFERNDRGGTDGWCTEHFRFHSMPEQVSLFAPYTVTWRSATTNAFTTNLT